LLAKLVVGINVSNTKKPAAKDSMSSSRASYEPIMLEAAKPQLRPLEHQENPAVDAVDEYQDDEASGVIPRDSRVRNTNGAQDFDTLVRESGLDDVAVRLFICGRNPMPKFRRCVRYMVDEGVTKMRWQTYQLLA